MNEHRGDCCCGAWVFGPMQNERRILIDGILYTIHGTGIGVHCTFEDQVMGRKGICPDPPPVVAAKMNELKSI